MKTLLHASNLGFRDRNSERVSGINLQLRLGEVVGLLGVNGAGKSTTLRLLTGALAPTSGSVRVMGLDLHRQPLQAKHHIGLLPESPPLYADLTVNENLNFAARLQGLSAPATITARERIKEQCGLADYGEKLVGKLSRGFGQRVGIAQAMIHQPAILVLDEPTVGLDPAQANALRELIKEVSPGCGIILASHILLDMEQLCQRVIILNEGRQVGDSAITPTAMNSVRLHLSAPPSDLIPLDQLPGVAATEQLAKGWIRLTLDQAPMDLAEQIAGKGWGMTAFVPEQADLLELFSRSISPPSEFGGGE